MMRSTIRVLTLLLMLLALPLAVSGCVGPASRFPPSADLIAVTEEKPKPTAEIARSAKANADYNASVESWGDRLNAAGGRLCRFFRDLGMTVDCPAAPEQ